jgi:putative PIN family toxin of toxin-antitoxin system
MNAVRLVVFDCNVFLQAILSRRGPAYNCFERVERGELLLVVSPFVLAEVRKLPEHRDLKRFVHLTQERVEAVLADVLKKAKLENDVPEVFTYARDPDDAHYVNLALKAGATLIVSRDKDLLDLNNSARAEGRDFVQRFPQLRIMQPTELIALLDGRPWVV